MFFLIIFLSFFGRFMIEEISETVFGTRLLGNCLPLAQLYLLGLDTMLALALGRLHGRAAAHYRLRAHFLPFSADGVAGLHSMRRVSLLLHARVGHPPLARSRRPRAILKVTRVPRHVQRAHRVARVPRQRVLLQH